MLIYGIEKKSKHGNNSFRIKKKERKRKTKARIQIMKDIIKQVVVIFMFITFQLYRHRFEIQ